MCEKCPDRIRCELLLKRTPLPLLLEHKLYKHCFMFQEKTNKGSYIGPVWGAKVLKKILSELYPQYKWSVQTSKYAGGNSIDCYFLDEKYDYGMAQEYPEHLREEDKAIDRICSQFEEGHFDGMTDMYEYDNKLMGCTKYCNSKRKSKRDWEYVVN